MAILSTSAVPGPKADKKGLSTNPHELTLIRGVFVEFVDGFFSVDGSDSNSSRKQLDRAENSTADCQTYGSGQFFRGKRFWQK